MAQWVDMEAEKNHALSACWCVTTLLEADSRLLICRVEPTEPKKHTRDTWFYFLPIEPFRGLESQFEAFAWGF